MQELVHTRRFEALANSAKFVACIHSAPQTKQPAVENARCRGPGRDAHCICLASIGHRTPCWRGEPQAIADWVTASRPDLESDVKKRFKDSANLTLARDLANGSKHMTTTGYDDDGSASVCERTPTNGRIPYVVPRPVGGGGNLEALPFADRCIEEFRAYMGQRGLLQ